MNNKKYQQIKNLYDMAIHETIEPEHLENTSLHAKCCVIYNVTKALKEKIPQHEYGTAKHTRNSLTNIVNSFFPSQALLNFQNQKRERFFNHFKKKENSDTRAFISDWDNIEEPETHEKTIVEISKLHSATYAQSVISLASLKYLFSENNLIQNKLNMLVLGSFYGDLSKESGQIKISKDRRNNSWDAENILDTIHHETTHFIQFSLANDFHHGRIRPDHPLFSDARMFHAIEVNNAIIPSGVLKSTERSAYENQVHEILARQEGAVLSAGVLELSR